MVILMTMFGLFDTGMIPYSELLVTTSIFPSQGWGDIWRATGQLLGADSSLFMKVGKLIGNSVPMCLLWVLPVGVTAAIVLTVGLKSCSWRKPFLR